MYKELIIKPNEKLSILGWLPFNETLNSRTHSAVRFQVFLKLIFRSISHPLFVRCG